MRVICLLLSSGDLSGCSLAEPRAVFGKEFPVIAVSAFDSRDL